MRVLFAIVLSVVIGAFTVGAKGCGDDAPPQRPHETVPWTDPAKLPVREHGTWCEELGMRARTADGIPLVCKKNPGEDMPRWRNG